MPLGILLVNVVSVSSSIGALTALVVLYLHLRSRGVLLLAVSVFLLTADFTLGLILFASPDTSLWLGLSGLRMAARGDTTLMAFKGMLLVGVLLTGPSAVYSLFGRRPSRAVVGTVSAVAAAGFAAAVCLLAGFAPDAWGVLSLVATGPGYAAYVACFLVLLANRGAARPGLSRSIVKAALVTLALYVPVMLANDVLLLVGTGPRLLPTDALGFLLLSGGVLVCSLLVLLGGRRIPAPVDMDAYCGEHDLSVREREVLLLLAEGQRYKQIADRLCISLDTVKSHASRIYRKTAASGRTDLMYRIRLGRL